MASQTDGDLSAPNTDIATEPSPAPSDAAGATTARQVEQLQDQLRRAVADLDNVRKRQSRELDRQRIADRNRLSAAWLPIIDNLDLALHYAESDPNGIVAGVRAVRDQALAVITDLGYVRHAESGVPFDPTRQEVVRVVEAPDVGAGTVLEVLRPGYGDGDQLLRAAAVSVAGHPT